MNDQQKKDTITLLATAGTLAAAFVASLVTKRFRSQPSGDSPAKDLNVAPKATANYEDPIHRRGEGLLTDFYKKQQEQREEAIAEQRIRDAADLAFRRQQDEVRRQQEEFRRQQDAVRRQQEESRRQQQLQDDLRRQQDRNRW